MYLSFYWGLKGPPATHKLWASGARNLPAPIENIEYLKTTIGAVKSPTVSGGANPIILYAFHSFLVHSQDLFVLGLIWFRFVIGGTLLVGSRIAVICNNQNRILTQIV